MDAPPMIAILTVMLLSCASAYDPSDPNGNITIKWDIFNWTPDGYVAMVSIFNFQQYRRVSSPGWSLSWTWSQKEVIWIVYGARATEQGDCSPFKENIPQSCNRRPTFVDLLPRTPYNQQTENCCKGGVIPSFAEDPENAISSFQIVVGQAGSSNLTVKLPKAVSFTAPRAGYTCAPVKIVTPSRYTIPNTPRITLALMTWETTCLYAPKAPTCCVSLSTFSNATAAPCPACSCGCRREHPGNCLDSNKPHMPSAITGKNSKPPGLQCTNHMCPISIHWHVMPSYRLYWRAKMTIKNFNKNTNYTQWNAVVQHPSFSRLTQVFNVNFKSLNPNAKNDTAMLWGVKNRNDVLMQSGTVESELLFRRAAPTSTSEKYRAFPRRVFFDGDNCVMPSRDEYPYLNTVG